MFPVYCAPNLYYCLSGCPRQSQLVLPTLPNSLSRLSLPLPPRQPIWSHPTPRQFTVSPDCLPSPPTASTVSSDAPDSSLLSLPTVSPVSPIAPRQSLLSRPMPPTVCCLSRLSTVAPDSLYCLARRPRQFTVSPDCLPSPPTASTVSPDGTDSLFCLSRQSPLFLPSPPTVSTVSPNCLYRHPRQSLLPHPTPRQSLLPPTVGGGGGPVTARPPSPPLRSPSSRGTPRSATSDRGGSRWRSRGAHGSPFSTGPVLPAGSPVADSDPAPPLSCLRGAAMTRRTTRFAAPAPDRQ